MIGVTWSAIYLAENINSQLMPLQPSNLSKTLPNVKKKNDHLNMTKNNQTNTFGIPEELPSFEFSSYLNNEKSPSNKNSPPSKNRKKGTSENSATGILFDEHNIVIVDPTRRTMGTSKIYSNETSVNTQKFSHTKTDYKI